jgi:hypothetical protein
MFATLDKRPLLVFAQTRRTTQEFETAALHGKQYSLSGP